MIWRLSGGAAVAAYAVLVLAAAPCYGGVVFQIGNHPQPGEENVGLNTGTTGTTVFGVTDQSGIQVAFSSITDT